MSSHCARCSPGSRWRSARSAPLRHSISSRRASCHCGTRDRGQIHRRAWSDRHECGGLPQVHAGNREQSIEAGGDAGAAGRNILKTLDEYNCYMFTKVDGRAVTNMSPAQTVMILTDQARQRAPSGHTGFILDDLPRRAPFLVPGMAQGRASRPSARHARLAVNAAMAWCSVMLDTLADAEAPGRTSGE